MKLVDVRYALLIICLLHVNIISANYLAICLENTLLLGVHCGNQHYAEKCGQCGSGTYKSRGSPQTACRGECEWSLTEDRCVLKGNYEITCF